MTRIRFSIAVLTAAALFSGAAAAQHTGIAPAEYRTRRSARAASIGPRECLAVMHDRGALGSAMTREQRFADDLRRKYPDVRFRDASPLLPRAMREASGDRNLDVRSQP